MCWNYFKYAGYIKIDDIEKDLKELKQLRKAFNEVYNSFAKEFNQFQKDSSELSQRMFKLAEKGDMILKTMEQFMEVKDG